VFCTGSSGNLCSGSEHSLIAIYTISKDLTPFPSTPFPFIPSPLLITHNWNDKAEHVNQTYFGGTAKGRKHFVDEASGLQMVF